MSLDQSVIERMGKADFSRESFLRAREIAWSLVHEVAALIRPGMTEPDAQKLLTEAQADLGLDKPWHRPIIRFGTDTLKNFSPRTDETIMLGERDIFFLDIGPVWQGYEADVGATFVLGDNAEMARCAADSKILFDLVRAEWLQNRVSGQDLYGFAAREAAARGWELLTDVDGHRLGDFPHHAHFRGGLGELDFHPSPDVWVLEIQIRHPTLAFGAFYEDLLIG